MVEAACSSKFQKACGVNLALDGILRGFQAPCVHPMLVSRARLIHGNKEREEGRGDFPPPSDREY